MTKTPQQSTFKNLSRKLLSGEFVQASDLLAKAHKQGYDLSTMLDTNQQSLLHFAMQALKSHYQTKKWTPQCIDIITDLYTKYGLEDNLDKDGLTPFMYAVDVTLSRSEYEKIIPHTNLSLCNRKLKNLLFCFVDYNQIEGLRVSLESLSANPEKKAELLAFQGQANLPTLLIHAVDLKRIEIIAILIEHRAPSYSQIGGVHTSALIISLKHFPTHPEIFNRLLEAEVNLKNHLTNLGGTLLHIAAETGFTEVCRTLIEKGLSPDTKDHQQHLPVHFSMIMHHTETSCYLLEKMKNLKFFTPDGKTLLHYACYMKSPATLKRLLEICPRFYSSSPFKKPSLHDPLSPLAYMVKENKIAYASLLIRAGHKLDEYWHRSYMTCPWLQKDTQSLGKISVNHAIEIKPGFLSQWSLLHEAISQGSHILVDLLLDHGADPNQTASNGISPLQLAVTLYKPFERPLIIESLLKAGALPNQKTVDDWCSPLITATMHNAIQVMRLLVHYGADVNLTCRDVSPVMIAHRYDSDIAMMYLLSSGAKYDSLLESLGEQDSFGELIKGMNSLEETTVNPCVSICYAILVSHGLIEKHIRNQDSHQLQLCLQNLSIFLFPKLLLDLDWDTYAPLYIHGVISHFIKVHTAVASLDILSEKSLRQESYRHYNLDFFTESNPCLDKVFAFDFIEKMDDPLGKALRLAKPRLILESFTLLIKYSMLELDADTKVQLDSQTLQALPNLNWDVAQAHLMLKVQEKPKDYLTSLQTIFWNLAIDFTCKTLEKDFYCAKTPSSNFCFQHAWHYIFTYFSPSTTIFKKLDHSLTQYTKSLESSPQKKLNDSKPNFRIIFDTPDSQLSPSLHIYNNLPSLLNMRDFIKSQLPQLITVSRCEVFSDVRMLLNYYFYTLQHTPQDFDRIDFLHELLENMEQHAAFLFDHEDLQTSYLTTLISCLKHDYQFGYHRHAKLIYCFNHIEKCSIAIQKLSRESIQLINQHQIFFNAHQTQTQNHFASLHRNYLVHQSKSRLLQVQLHHSVDQTVATMSEKYEALLKAYEKLYAESQIAPTKPQTIESEVTTTAAIPIHQDPSIKLQETIANLEKKIGNQRTTIRSHQEQIEKKQSSYATLKESYLKLDSDKKSLELCYDKLTEELRVANQHKLTAQNTLSEKTLQLQDAQNTHHAEIGRLGHQKADLETQIQILEDSLHKRSTELTTSQAQIRKEKSSNQKRLTELQKKFESAKSLREQTLRQEYEEKLLQEKQRTELQAQTYQSQIDALKQELEEYKKLAVSTKENPSQIQDSLSTSSSESTLAHTTSLLESSADTSLESTSHDTKADSGNLEQQPASGISHCALNMHNQQDQETPTSTLTALYLTPDHPFYYSLSRLTEAYSSILCFNTPSGRGLPFLQQYGSVGIGFLESYFSSPHTPTYLITQSLTHEHYYFLSSSMPIYLSITQKILYPILEELKQCVYEICGDDKDIEVGLCGQQSVLWLLSYFHPIPIQNFMPDDFDLYCYVPESKLNLVKQNLYLRLTSTLESFNYHIYPFQKTPSRIATLQKCQTIFDIHVFSKPKRAFLSECFLQYHPQESGPVSKSSFFSCSFNHITTPKIQFLLGQRIPIQPLSRNEVPTFYWAAHTAIQLYNYHEKFFSTHATLDDFVNLSITQHGFNRRDKATNVQDIFSLIECFCSKKLAPTLWEFLQKPLASLYDQSLLDIVINCEEKTSPYNPISRSEAQYLACELMQDEVPFYYKLSVFFTKITHNQRLNASPNRLTIIDREQNHYFLNFNTYPVLCPIDQPPIFKNYLGMRLPNPLSQQTIFLQANEKITPSYSDRSRQKSHTKKNA